MNHIKNTEWLTLAEIKRRYPAIPRTIETELNEMSEDEITCLKKTITSQLTPEQVTQLLDGVNQSRRRID